MPCALILKSLFSQELFSGQSNLYSDKLGPNFDLAIEMDDTPVPEEPHTLENFAMQHFNSLPKRTLSKALANSLRKRERDASWSFSKVELLFCRYLLPT